MICNPRRSRSSRGCEEHSWRIIFQNHSKPQSCLRPSLQQGRTCEKERKRKSSGELVSCFTLAANSNDGASLVGRGPHFKTDPVLRGSLCVNLAFKRGPVLHKIRLNSRLVDSVRFGWAVSFLSFSMLYFIKRVYQPLNKWCVHPTSGLPLRNQNFIQIILDMVKNSHRDIGLVLDITFFPKKD